MDQMEPSEPLVLWEACSSGDVKQFGFPFGLFSSPGMAGSPPLAAFPLPISCLVCQCSCGVLWAMCLETPLKRSCLLVPLLVRHLRRLLTLLSYPRA